MTESEALPRAAAPDRYANLNELLLAHVPAMMWVTDRELRLLTVQGGLLSAEHVATLVGRTIPEIYGPQGLSFIVDAHRAALEGTIEEYDIPWSGHVHLVRVQPLVGAGGAVEGVVGLSVDATQSSRRDAQRRLTAAVGEVVVRGGDLTDLLQRCVQAAVDVLGLPVARIWMADNATRTLSLRTQAGEPIVPYTRTMPFGPWDPGGFALERRPVMGATIDDVEGEAAREWARQHGLTHFFGVPLYAGTELLGVLTASERRAIRPDVQDAMRALGDELALAIDRDRAQARLAAGEARYRELFDRARTPIIVFDPLSLRIVECNEGTIELFGFQREELASLRMTDLHPPKARRSAKAWLSAATPSSSPRLFEYRCRDGRVRDVELLVQEADWNGRTARIAWVFDLTDRLEASRLQREMVNRVIEAQEQERRHIARELHDHLGQHLAAQGLMIRSLTRVVRGERARERLELLRTSCEDIGRELQELAFLLRPAALDDFGIVGALEGLVDTWAKHHQKEVSFTPDAVDGVQLHASVETAVYRIAQEALTNVAKHADASRVHVSVRVDGSALTMIIQDDGSGMLASRQRPRTRPRSRGFGMVSMKDRADAIGGTLEIDSARAAGTRLHLVVPLAEPGRR